MFKKLSHGSMNRSLYAYLLITPGLALVGVILVFPLIRGVLSSFYSQASGDMSFDSFVGLNHFKSLFLDKIFIKSLFNSLVWTTIIVIALYIIGLALSLLLNKNFKGRGIFRSIILIPWVVPGIAAAMTWKWMYSSQYGIINHVLQSLGIINSNIDWLGSTTTALGSIIVVAIWKDIPFVTIVLLAALQSIDNTLYEAIKIDGGNAWQSFRYITMNGIKKVSITTILLEIIWTFNKFDLVYAMTKGGPSNSTQIIPVYTYITAFNFFRLNKAAAVGVVGLLLVGVFAIIYNIYNNREDV
jgi:ABC-type sugar transport system permease subunit